MNNHHERCSELLDRHVAGTLDADESSWVEAHLATCNECAAELTSVRALHELESASPLTEVERARMRRVVLQEAVPLPEEPAAAPLPAASRGVGWYRILGAAALIAVIGAFAYLGFGDPGLLGGSDDQEAATGAGGDTGGGGEGGSGAEPETFELEQDAEALDAAPGAGAASKAAPPLPSYEGSMGSVDTAEMNRLGRRGLPLVLFSRSYSVEDVAAVQAEYVEQLASQAPAARGQDIRDCTALVTSDIQNALPAFAGFGEYEDRGDILVLAFAWTDEDAGPLDRSMVWAWAIGDCEGTPVHYSTNVIRPRG
ncbi:MAG TPA: zf-HC2 domain-containing protein [Actinomycetota bacterium]|nr:zf-HC2 domain-containing protein [Actinomycetota bacterium]